MERIIILVNFLAIIIGIKYIRTDWISPACINIYWNFFFIFLAVIVFGGDIAWNYTSLLWIIASCLIFFLGEEAGSRISIDFNQRKIYEYGIKKTSFLVLVILIIIGLINPLIYIYAYGYTFKDVFSFNQLLEINAVIAADRYSGNSIKISNLAPIIAAITYMGGLCGGYLFNYATQKAEKIVSVIVIIPTLALALVTNAKVGVIATTFLWGVGWILSYINKNGMGVKLSKKFLMMFTFFSTFGITLLYFLMLLRVGSFNAAARRVIADKMQIYAFGQINAFSNWFSNMGDLSYSLGGSTYLAIPNLLGITVRKQGVYGVIDGAVSNIYTQNRGIIEDFGIFGGLVFWCILGIFAGIFYRRVKSKSRMSALSMSLLGAIYFEILYGFIISPWVYTSYMLAFIGFGVFLIFIRPRNFRIAEE